MSAARQSSGVSRTAPGAGARGTGQRTRSTPRPGQPRRVHLISLGCPKNLVDSERLLGGLAAAGWSVVDDPAAADLLAVNTCGFLLSARQESIDVILDLAALKERSGARLAVVGCLVERNLAELRAELPEVDYWLGVNQPGRLAELVDDAPGAPAGLTGTRARGGAPGASGKTPRGGTAAQSAAAGTQAHAGARHGSAPPTGAHYLSDPAQRARHADPDVPRLRAAPGHRAYLKISEGCSCRCAFCLIPAIRGPQVSRPLQALLDEAAALADAGVVELTLIAQNLSAYGLDRYGRPRLAELLRRLDRPGFPPWIRCLYLYPAGLDAELIETLAGAERVLKYVDLPLQTIADHLLRRMRRGLGERRTRELVARLRERVPGLSLRSSFIVGLPGESEADFQLLCDFVAQAGFDHLGVFAFSPEDGTPAATMDGQVPAAVARRRARRLLALQRGLSRRRLRALRGQVLPVLVEGPSAETELLLAGRHPGQAAEIDGLTYISEGTASPGQIVSVRIEQSHDYDLVGRIVEPAFPPPASTARTLDQQD